MSGAYYNEFDPAAAAWLRELIKRKLIADGEVDERSIEDVTPNELRRFTQCHFFAGIGVWSYALRRAGWPDDRRIWTGSCPCQPFSSAGKGAGFNDERHLWPAWFHLISQCCPERILGEQVASKDADAWIDLVHTDMEALGYAFGAVPFPSAGVGAPHIRDRLYWVADTESYGHEWRGELDEQTGRPRIAHGGTIGRMGEPNSAGRYTRREGSETARYGCAVESTSSARRMADPNRGQCNGEPIVRGIERDGENTRRTESSGSIATRGDTRRVGDTIEPGLSFQSRHGNGSDESRRVGAQQNGPTAETGAIVRTAPTNGFWRDADWLGCRDGKWRPVEPGTFPLANEAPARMGRLRGYGNAVNAEAATTFIQAVMGV